MESNMSENVATETSVAPKADAAPKLSIAQKMDNLKAQKVTATSEMNSLPEGSPERLAVEESIKVMDRQLRWYEGRSGSKAEKAARPSKATKASGKAKAATSSTKPTSTPPSAANES